MSIKELLKNSSLPSLETEMLLSRVLGLNRTLIFAYPEKQLTPKQEEEMQNLIQRRQKAEPIAYLLKQKEFYGLNFFVDSRVLIPRSETEQLVDKVLELSKKARAAIVEVGTGSGAVSIALAKNLPWAKIYATDLSPQALEVAKINAQKHHVGNITFLPGHLLQPLDKNIQPDFILANLPYIPTKSYEKLEAQIKDWEPKIALDSGSFSLQIYEELFKQSEPFLKKGARLFYELDGEILEYKESACLENKRSEISAERSDRITGR